MEAKDLMVENLIFHEGKTKIVKGLDVDFVYLDNLTCDPEEYSSCEPIPLTEEWLIKFGFDLNESEFPNIKGMPLKRCLGSDFYEYLTMLDNPIIKHVHQLQNLYKALTGEELKIKEV